MRGKVVALVVLVVLGGYVYALTSNTTRSFVEPEALDPRELGEIVPPDALPPAFESLAEHHGYRNVRPSGRMAYSAQLFQDPAGNRIAIEVEAYGTRWAYSNMRAGDALCSQPWPDGECDRQFNPYRYTFAVPLTITTDSTASSARESSTGARVRNDTFWRAGMRITVTI